MIEAIRAEKIHIDRNEDDQAITCDDYDKGILQYGGYLLHAHSTVS